MGERSVKVLNQRIDIFRMLRLYLHFHVAFPYRRRHFALTHIFSDHGIARIDRLLDMIENLLEICLAAAKARRSK